MSRRLWTRYPKRLNAPCVCVIIEKMTASDSLTQTFPLTH